MTLIFADFPHVTAVAVGPRHHFSKEVVPAINIIADLGVEGDAHCGSTVKHLFDMRRNPAGPNLRQVHLMQAELLETLVGCGFAVGAGALGENVTTRGLALTELPLGTRLHLGSEAVVELTGLRQPCIKLDRLHNGLRAAVSSRSWGETFTEASVMARAVTSGLLRPRDRIVVALPSQPHRRLQCV